MNKSPKYWNSAKRYLKKKDKIMKKLINKYSDNNLTTRKDVFFSLCKSIIGQQISVAAANSVFLKFNLACKGKINPKVVNLITTSKLKKCGLSRQKIRGIKELAKKYVNKEFNPSLINNMNDEEALEKSTVEPKKIIASKKLTSGPAIATRNVPIAVEHSFSTCEIPPRKKTIS